MQRLVDLTIHQDWDRTRSVLQKYTDLRVSGQLDANKIGDSPNGLTVYSGDDFMTRVANDLIKTSAGYGSGQVDLLGPALESTLPWIDQAKELFREINLHDVAFFKTNKRVQPHIDYTNYDNPDSFFYIKSGRTSKKQCKIIYIVSSEDTQAVTTSYDHNDKSIQWNTPSVPGTAFLLDTSYLHEVKNTKDREIFRFLFDNDYDTVSKFLDKMGPIVFSG